MIARGSDYNKHSHLPAITACACFRCSQVVSCCRELTRTRSAVRVRHRPPEHITAGRHGYFESASGSSYACNLVYAAYLRQHLRQHLRQTPIELAVSMPLALVFLPLSRPCAHASMCATKRHLHVILHRLTTHVSRFCHASVSAWSQAFPSSVHPPDKSIMGHN